jgi:hypothetical protein
MFKVKCKFISSDRGIFVNIVKSMLLATFVGSFGHQAAAGIEYSPVLPQFGGNNGQALAVLQYDSKLQSAADAKIAAAASALEKALEPDIPALTATDRLILSIQSALQVRLANSYANQIFDTVDTAVPVTITLDATTITYDRTDGYLTIDIIDDFGALTEFGIDLDTSR